MPSRLSGDHAPADACATGFLQEEKLSAWGREPSRVKIGLVACRPDSEVVMRLLMLSS